MRAARQRPPRQRRGRETRERLLGAAAAILAEHGYDGFNLTAVSQRAGVSYGAMYWYFADRDALLEAVHERHMDGLESLAAPLRDPGRWEQASLDELVGGVVDCLGGMYAHEPGLLRAIALHAGADRSVFARAEPAVARLGDDVIALLAPHLDRAGHPEPRQAAEDVFVVVVSALSARVTWPGFFERPGIPWQRLVRRLGEIALADIHAALARRP